MKQIKLLVSFPAIFFTLVFFLSCRQDLISEPNINKIKDSSNNSASYDISAPENLSATHGTYRSVNLTWTRVAGATRYKIFSADSPYDDMEQIAETKNAESHISIEENPGIAKYYSIKAVDYNKKESSFSGKAFGSTMAIPIITSIVQETEGTAATVHWWMENCSEKTYLNSVRYEVSCYAEDKATQIGSTIVISNGSQSATFTGLSPKTKYYYKVEVRILSDQINKETSELIDAETARKLTPNPPEEFKALKGTNASAITLSIKLPDFVDSTISTGEGYQAKPVYFTIQRKELGNSNADYKTIARYLGSIQPSGIDKEQDAAKGIFYFSITDSAKNSSNIRTIKDDDTEAVYNANYPDYVSKSYVYFTDENDIERKKQYVYKIQTYIDDIKNTVSSDDAIKTDEGWLIDVPQLSANAVFEQSGNKFTKIIISFTPDFDSRGLSNIYNYTLLEKYTPFMGDTVNSASMKSKKSENISSALSDIVFDCNAPDFKKGYYKYILYISDFSKSIEDSQLETSEDVWASAAIAGQFAITDDATATPVLNLFSVQDGYADKFKLSWNFNENYSYSLEWTNHNSDDSQISQESLDFTEEQLNEIKQTKDSSGNVYYEHSAPAGTRRKYTIKAKSVLTTTKAANSIYETLGIPQLSQTEINYDSMEISWDKVQKADTYEVSAIYEGDVTNKELAVNQDETAYTITPSVDNNTYKCVLTKPFGYNNAQKAGLPIKFKVTAKNSAANSSNASTIIVKLLGPAIVNATAAESPTAWDSINLKWNKIEGAAGYLIYRISYTDTAANSISGSDLYYFDGEKVKLNDSEISSVKTSLTGNTYTLQDLYKEPEAGITENAKYFERQSQIPWGLPYGYVVLPVKKSDDFKFQEDKLLLEDTSKVNYTKHMESGTPVETPFETTKSSSYGYGQKVMAEKAVKGSVMILQWSMPYFRNLTPTIYRRTAESSNLQWDKVSTTAKIGDTSVSFIINGDERFKAYEYAVRYSYSKDNSEFAPSFITAVSKIKENRYNYPTGIETELLNKGYLLAIKLEATYGGTPSPFGGFQNDDYYYSEKVSWDTWNYEERKLGPDSVSLEVLNNNRSDKYIQILTLNNKTFKIPESQQEIDLSGDERKIKIKNSGGNTIYISPHFIDDSTNGILQVLRDEKHYYQFTLRRESDTVESGKDQTVYGYRQITDKELVRAALLNIAYAFYYNGGGKENLSNIETAFKYNGGITITSPNGGKGYFGSRSLLGITESGKYKADVTLENYAPKMLLPSGKTKASFIKVSFDNVSTRTAGLSNAYLDLFRTENFTVTVANTDETFPINYQAELITSCKGSHNVTVRKSGKTIIDTNDLELRRKWFPIELYEDNSYLIKSSAHGWWPAE